MGTYFIGLAGEAQRNPDGKWRSTEIRKCRPNEPVHLIREPANPYDGNAVRVDSARGITIGYIPRDHAKWIAGRMDKGKPPEAVIKSINQATGTPNVGVVIMVATSGENIDRQTGIMDWLARLFR